MTLYEAGSSVCEANPFVHVIGSGQKRRRCDNCLEPSLNLMRCAKCLLMYYCSKECQVEDWKSAHKFKECELFRNKEAAQLVCRLPQMSTAVDFPSMVALTIRTVLKVKLDPDAEKKVRLYDGRERGFSDLMSHADQIKRDKGVVLILTGVQKILEKVQVIVELNELIELQGRLTTNSFYISDGYPTEANIATALYLEASIFDHSCDRNCIRSFEGKKMIVRASRTFDTAFESATLSYCNVLQPRDERRAKLKRSFFFDCQCKRCSSDDDFGFDYEAYSKLHKMVNPDNPRVTLEAHKALVAIELAVLRGYSHVTVTTLADAFRIAKVFKLKEETKELEERFEKAAKIVYGSEEFLNVRKKVDLEIVTYGVFKKMTHLNFE